MSATPEKYIQSPTPPFNPNEIPDAQKNPDVASLYFNSFSMGVTNADVVLLLKQNNIPKVSCNMSLTVAKTLSRQLNAMIINFEKHSDSPIMTSDVIDTALTKMRNDK